MSLKIEPIKAKETIELFYKIMKKKGNIDFTESKDKPIKYFYKGILLEEYDIFAKVDNENT